MKISRIQLAMLRVPLKTPFKTALRTVEAVEDVVVIITTDTGHVGYGEAPATAVITGERGDGSLTRQGLEEYVSDCVILLDHRVTEQTSTRRLRIVKYRGALHGTKREAMKPGAFLLHPDVGTYASIHPIANSNIMHHYRIRKGELPTGRLNTTGSRREFELPEVRTWVRDVRRAELRPETAEAGRTASLRCPQMP